MALEINPSIADKLPITVKSALSKMSSEEQMMFQEQFQKKSMSTGLMVFLAIFFPIQLFLLGKTGLGIVFILTAGGVWIWWIIEWFLTPKRVREYNEDVATKILTEMKIMSR
ncbi:MAG: TM2 domain-containing protein [candidate division Zixibacteria bacterium]|nr:TM2 domain-containing protein [candidate division Zixibacteria bacterium]